MKRVDKAFWLTIIPVVLVWNVARDPLLGILHASDPGMTSRGTPEAWTNVAFAAAVAFVAGYVGGFIARPECWRAAMNIAFGLVVCLGVQNFVDYRDHGLSARYFVLLPATAAVLALVAGVLCRLHWGRSSSA